MNVLVIEDEPTSLKLFHLVLASEGFGVRDAEAGASALASIRANKPEVVLLDLALPDMNGLEFVRQLKGDPELRGIVIVAVTAFPDVFSREQALAAGCDVFIVKPVDTRALSKQVTQAVETKAAGEKNKAT